MSSTVPPPPSGSVNVRIDSDKEKGGGFTLRMSADKVVGTGSFGVVFEAKIVETGESVAIKKVLQDRRFKNRELQVMKTLKHPNIVTLKHYFYQTQQESSGKEGGDEVYLNLVMEFVPDTVYKVTRYYVKQRQLPPLIIVKLYTYQMCRALAHLHGVGICHRDIKPQNLLVDSKSQVLKLCDFGSAKALVPGEASVAYICSRYYRAPELIFGATDYTTAIDVWSAGCVSAELLLGHPLFPGDTGVDQLVEIIKVLGTPTKEEVEAMNPSYTEFQFPQVKPFPWAKLFKPKPPQEAIDLITKMLTYVPTQRYTAIQCCTHPFFDELRDPSTRLPDGSPLPPLFNFTIEELKGTTPEMRDMLLPPHARTPQVMAVLAALDPSGATMAASSGTGSSARPAIPSATVPGIISVPSTGVAPARNTAPSVMPAAMNTKHYPSGIDPATHAGLIAAGATAAAVVAKSSAAVVASGVTPTTARK